MTISAVLLAGGKSSRMGQDKATISFRGDPLWKRQIDLLRRIRPKEILVSAQTDPAWRPADVVFVADRQPPCGPLGGIAAALAHFTSDHVLVLAIDLPFMTETYLQDLCARVEPGCGVVPAREDRAEPLVAIYPREAEPEFSSALSISDFSLQPVIRRLIGLGKLRGIDIAADETPLFQNLNAPQDLADR